MAEDESRRRGEDPGGEKPSGQTGPIRASRRARLRGLDGVRRDDHRDPQSAPDSAQQPPAARREDRHQAASGPAAPAPGSTSSSGSPGAHPPEADPLPSRRSRRAARAQEASAPRASGPQTSASRAPGPQDDSRRAASAPAPEPSTPAAGWAPPSSVDAAELGTGSPRHASRAVGTGAGGAAAGAATSSGSGSRAAAKASASPRREAASARRTDSGEEHPSAEHPSPAQPSRRSRRDTHAAAAAPADAQPRHSRRTGEGFSSLVRWTTLGTLLPGLGLIHGRHRRGWIVLIGFLAVIAVVIGWIVWRTPVRALARVAGDPILLYSIAGALAVAVVIWIITILRSYRVLRRGTRMTSPQRGLGWALVAALIVCVAVPLGVGSAYSKVHADAIVQVFGRSGGAIAAKDDLWADKERINVFLIGRDNGDGREGTRPDTMLVASIDTRAGDTTLISVPRNLNRAQFPEGSALAERFPLGFDGFGPDESLINAVWTWAEQNPESVGEVSEGLDVGMEATMQAVEGSLGLDLDYYTSVDMAGFEDVIDAIGGVRIDVERPIPMGGGTNMNTGLKNPINDWIDPGEQVLRGKKALWYVRSRDGADNYDRMCRQQRMIKTTLDQINPQELAAAYPKLAGSAERNIQTDIAQNEVPAFVELAIAMQRSEIKSAQINNDVVATVSPDYEALHSWVQEQINPAEPSQAEEASGGETAEEAPEEEPTPEATEEPEQGVENAEGKCYPRGYEPGSGWPGWPGPGGEQE